MDDMINSGRDLPKWIITEKTILCQKNPNKINAVDNYWPILCLPLTWKLMTEIIANSAYEYLEMHYLLPGEQKGCRKTAEGQKINF